MADIILNDEDILAFFTEETPVHANFMNPIIENVNKNTTRSKENSSQIGQNSNKIAQLSNPYLLINGDFQIWQRGTSFTSFLDSIVTYIADRWYVAKAPGTTVSVIKDSDNSLKFSQTGLGSSHIAQFIEGDYSNLVGKKLTMSVCSKSNVDTIMAMFDYTVPIDSRLVPASTEYTIKSLTVQLPNSITKDRLRCFLNFANNQGSINIKWVKLELGEIATPFSPRPYGEELALCQRYYEIIPMTPTFIGAQTSTNILGKYKYNVQKRISPTVVFKDPAGNVGTCRRGILGGSQTDGQAISKNSTSSTEYLVAESGAGVLANYIMFSATADAEIY